VSRQRAIEAWADWEGLGGPRLVGRLSVTVTRGKEVLAFEYEPEWLKGTDRHPLDPALGLYAGPQYPAAGRETFGVFLDSCPDRWGRVLMRRREAQIARVEGREERHLLESDYLLGVHDAHRMGAMRFRTDGPFLDDNDELAAPPWASLRELEQASQKIEGDNAEEQPDYGEWLRMLIAPGGSLGGARPKASVLDERGHPWIAKFPGRRDGSDVGAWEGIVHELARDAGLVVPEARTQRFGSAHHTFLSRRFDRTTRGERLHFASAMTLLERRDGDDASVGVSYLELADFLIRQGANAAADLEQLWRRIVFSTCVSNTDDHLRNHGFLLGPRGWSLAPAYDVNPVPQGEGLKLNISESDNAQDLALVTEVAPFFRVNPKRATAILGEVVAATRGWRDLAGARGISKAEQDRMQRAFRVADSRA